MSTQAKGSGRVRSFRDAKRYRLQVRDACFLDGDPRALYFVVGVLDGERVEAVSGGEIKDKTIVDPHDLDDVIEAVGDGRLGTYAIARDRLLPYPASYDIDEVRR